MVVKSTLITKEKEIRVEENWVSMTPERGHLHIKSSEALEFYILSK